MIIVTHPGSAHRDEFLACCLLLADDNIAPHIERIERRDCKAEDLEDRNTIVLDQGGMYSEPFHNYDHHQLGRDAAPVCSITMVLTMLGIDILSACGRTIFRIICQ